MSGRKYFLTVVPFSNISICKTVLRKPMNEKSLRDERQTGKSNSFVVGYSTVDFMDLI